MASSTTQKRRQRTIDANTRLKFRPAESKLSQQLRDAADALDSGVASAHSVAAVVKEAASQAIPKIQGVVGQQQGLSDQLRAVAPALDPASGFGKAAAVESQGAARRLGELQTNAVADYIGQQARATQGEAFQIANLRNKHAATVDRIGQQAVDLALQKGDYAAGLAGKYEDKDLQNAFSRAQQKRSFAHADASREDSQAASRDAAAARERKARGKDAHVSPKDQGALEDAVKTVSEDVAVYASHSPRSVTEHLLQRGAPAVPRKFDPDRYAALLKANPTMDKTVARAKATTEALPAVPRVTNVLALQIALDLAYHHRLTAKTIKLLHSRKYKAASWPTSAPRSGPAVGSVPTPATGLYG